MIKLSPSKTGSINELFVCVELLRQGWDVFRAQSAACPADLIIMDKNGKTYAVEVTTGYNCKLGKVSYPPHKKGIFEFLIAVMPDGSMFWFDKNGDPTEMPQIWA